MAERPTDGVGQVGKSGFSEGSRDSPVEYRLELAARLQRAVKILLVSLAHNSQYGQGELHVFVVIQPDPGWPEGHVLAVVGYPEPMTEFFLGETVVEDGADVRLEFVPFLGVKVDHGAVVGAFGGYAFASEVDAHMGLHTVVFHKKLIAGLSGWVVERLDLIHEMVLLEFTPQSAVKAGGDGGPLGDALYETSYRFRHLISLDVAHEPGGGGVIDYNAAHFAAVHSRCLQAPFAPEAEVEVFELGIIHFVDVREGFLMQNYLWL